MGTATSPQRSRSPEQTRRAITEALLDLLRESGRVPTAATIATRAGVSRRSVFVHFSDMDELHVEAGHRQAERLLATVEPISPALPLPERISRFADQLERVYEIMTPVRRVALAASASPVVSGLINEGDEWLRGMLSELFAAEFADRDPLLPDIVDAAVSWGSWYQLRRLSADDRRRCFRELLGKLIAA
ncbi:TetR/AcrR family transcriptional regulator [Actinomadura sp. HBU206391]|uniref:TetR/AcrR family transcriptional regulator n=1 Tax=Actinomadura sp. HBU206391 TaxID=2731692 RepID=UPI00165074E6|nr:TetR/AcrR family transcriptional regulator [Actinomadura sp. HBU206391]MBC6461668.1 TetR/AcrR family transcriptional regulator [Actinomadura sp. HBU206391]